MYVNGAFSFNCYFVPLCLFCSLSLSLSLSLICNPLSGSICNVGLVEPRFDNFGCYWNSNDGQGSIITRSIYNEIIIHIKPSLYLCLFFEAKRSLEIMLSVF